MKKNELILQKSARTDDKLRVKALHQWITRHLHYYELITDSLICVASEASYRRYYRIHSARTSHSFIIMDSAPWLEDNVAFVTVAKLLASASISVPTIYEWDQTAGFLLIEDMGEDTLLGLNLHSDCETARPHYHQAIDTLLKIQANANPDTLPHYSHPLMRDELNLFIHWNLNKNLHIKLKNRQQQKIITCLDLITQKNQMIARTFVHRDYRPGNLIISCDRKKISIIDFQDAVKGPITYDLVSLLWDSFHCWDDTFTAQMVYYYWSAAVTMRLPVASTFSEFENDIYWTCLQRHLRVIGIFARLGIREGKTRYLQEIHRFNQYLTSRQSHDKKTQPLIDLLNQIRARPCQ